MAATLAALGGEELHLPIETALVSVYDKAGLEVLAELFKEKGVHVLSTGGTAKKLRDLGCTVQDVAEYTGSPEILDGRVKTLHPKIHGGLLAVRGNAKHAAEMKEHGIRKIDLVVANLYPFEEALKQGLDHAGMVENIDIGGPCMTRAAAKAHQGVAILSHPGQYAALAAEVRGGGGVSPAYRRKLAAAAFAQTAQYDAQISKYWAAQLAQDAPAELPATIEVSLVPERKLKYGCNPHQHPAAVCSVDGQPLPIEVLNGTPGFINFLDALNAWGLVRELKQATGLPAAASFKHVSPAGAAVAVPLSDLEKQAFEVTTEPTGVTLAYIRARQGDPLCSFGDFVAVSETVDAELAEVLRTAVSDGIIAPGFEPGALEVLKAKKKGGFVVILAKDVPLPETEVRTVGGVGLVQKRNDVLFSAAHVAPDKVVTKRALPEDAQRDCIVASISIKYTQSNSVGYAKSGMMIGVGAGQQSRVDCVKLAGRKVSGWYLRQHPKVLALPFKAGVKKQERINARVAYIEGSMTPLEKEAWVQLFDAEPEALGDAEKLEFLAGLKGVTVSSDAFFPFRDSIDYCSRYGVEYVVQPGGSVQDQEVIATCDSYNMSMAFTGLRLFHH